MSGDHKGRFNFILTLVAKFNWSSITGSSYLYDYMTYIIIHHYYISLFRSFGSLTGIGGGGGDKGDGHIEHFALNYD